MLHQKKSLFATLPIASHKPWSTDGGADFTTSSLRPRRRTVCGAGLFAANYGRRLSTFAFFPICRQIFGAQIREKRSVLSITRRKLGSDFSDALGGSRQGHSDGIACQTVYGTCLRRKPQ